MYMNTTEYLPINRDPYSQGVSSFHDLILPILPLREKIQYIFSSTFDREARYDRVSATLASSIEKLPSPLREDAGAQTKKIMALAKKLLNASFKDIFDFQTLVELIYDEYSQENPTFIERMNNPNNPWKKTPDLWVKILIKQERIHCAQQVFEGIPDGTKKSTAGKAIAVAYAKQGNPQKVIDFLQNSLNAMDHDGTIQEILGVYFVKRQYDAVQELIDSNILQPNYMEQIGFLFLEDKEFARAHDMIPRIPEGSRNNFIHDLAIAMYKQSEWRARSLALAETLPNDQRAAVKSSFLNPNRVQNTDSLPPVFSLLSESNLKTSQGVIDLFNHLEQKKENKELKKIDGIYERISEDLFENQEAEKFFRYVNETKLTNTSSPFRILSKYLLQRYCDAGQFDEAIYFSHQLVDMSSSVAWYNVRDIHILCERVKWNLQHPKDPHVFRFFAPELPEELLEALATGRYAEVVTLLKESFGHDKTAQYWFECIYLSLDYSNSSEKVLLMANFFDHIPYEWKGSVFEDQLVLRHYFKS